ncbi:MULTISPECIES: hypothetical protein [Delftia]|uniref:hypothetical protein n=1 Tax=Delftia TaxID=80865 RepID=UPI00115FF5A4|nr:hypothetical protein [Delftia lacustris]
MAGGPELGYPMASAVTSQVSAASLSWPAGWVFIKGLICRGFSDKMKKRLLEYGLFNIRSDFFRDRN